MLPQHHDDGRRDARLLNTLQPHLATRFLTDLSLRHAWNGLEQVVVEKRNRGVPLDWCYGGCRVVQTLRRTL
jgi:hypothetical protein